MKYNVKRHAVVQPQDQSLKLIPLTQGQNAVVDAFKYDWLVQWNWCAKWDSKSQTFYACRNKLVDGKFVWVSMHREITGNVGEQTDHWNQDTLDNRIANLRPCSPSQNGANRGKNSNNKSGYKGVSWHKKQREWVAQARLGDKYIYLGGYSTKEEAFAVYCEFTKTHRQEFARFS